MKKILFLTVLTITFNIYSQQKGVFSNADCIKLAKVGLSEKLILQKINSEETCNFDLSIDELIKLKQAGVTDNVIQAMMQKQKLADKNIGSFSFTYNNKKYQLPNSGIYFLNNGEFVELNSTSITSANSKSGFVNVKMVNELEGNKANYNIQKPGVFVFAFDNMNKSLNDSNSNSIKNESNNSYENMIQIQQNNLLGNSNNQKAVSPNEFKLIKLDVSRNKRQFTGGRISMFGQYDASIKDKNIGTFKYEALNNNIFVISLGVDNNPGEYCFMYAGNIQQSTGFGAMFANKNNNKVYDFTLR